ncbi:flagellar export chaperone FliS [Paenibacillus sp. SYP-B4298]|uniref:flagellar export chaperone FliS n=1 Tax=Paenibacillus sp. SYP-B4298 TaxID=2996034 RepID=UPI0022DD7638|nr:flagellar export chaperone FliS [Paenibacillus sp. SYP-B4298]
MQLQQRNKYLETTIQTASPAQLLIMLYDGAIRNCRAGIEAIKGHRIEEANTHIQKCQDIISEFTITLDRTSPIADNLLQLYDYFNRQLTEANIRQNPEPAEEILNLLVEMKETWMQAARQLSQSTPTGAGHGSYSPTTRTTVV